MPYMSSRKVTIIYRLPMNDGIHYNDLFNKNTYKII